MTKIPHKSTTLNEDIHNNISDLSIFLEKLCELQKIILGNKMYTREPYHDIPRKICIIYSFLRKQMFFDYLYNNSDTFESFIDLLEEYICKRDEYEYALRAFEERYMHPEWYNMYGDENLYEMDDYSCDFEDLVSDSICDVYEIIKDEKNFLALKNTKKFKNMIDVDYIIHDFIF